MGRSVLDEPHLQIDGRTALQERIAIVDGGRRGVSTVGCAASGTVRDAVA